jgi:hypothetical protein
MEIACEEFDDILHYMRYKYEEEKKASKKASSKKR